MVGSWHEMYLADINPIFLAGFSFEIFVVGDDFFGHAFLEDVDPVVVAINKAYGYREISLGKVLV